MRPEPGEVLHFSEDPTITEFVPHVARTATDPVAYVWAVDEAHAPQLLVSSSMPAGDGCGGQSHHQRRVQRNPTRQRTRVERPYRCSWGRPRLMW